MTLDAYRALGRSGLVVSPLALGTMTFGNPAWGSSDAASRAIFDAFVEAGGNFIDTADVYSGGRSEELLGSFIGERGLRDRLVLATKFGFNADPGNPHAGGNGRKAIHRALEGSLRRLRTDAIDLYWMHIQDTVTPVEEVLQTLGDLVRAGKIRYFGLSNLPAWVAAKMGALAGVRGIPGPIALQLEYSLVERGIEREHRPAAREEGMGLVPWSPLAGGFLAGTYRREEFGIAGTGRLSGPNPFQGRFSKFTDCNWRILDELRAVASALSRPAAQVALAWLLARPGVNSVLLGVSRPEQLAGNLAALDLRLEPEHVRALDEASAPDQTFTDALATPEVRRMIFGGKDVEAWR